MDTKTGNIIAAINKATKELGYEERSELIDALVRLLYNDAEYLRESFSGVGEENGEYALKEHTNKIRGILYDLKSETGALRRAVRDFKPDTVGEAAKQKEREEWGKGRLAPPFDQETLARINANL